MTTYTRKDPHLLKSKIGIEIEGSIGNDIHYENIAQMVRTQLLSRDPNASFREFEHEKYEIKYYKPGSGIKTWIIENDQSIITRRNPFEISSPILEDQEDFEIFKDVIHGLQELGAHPEPSVAGVHVHVDFSDARLGEMALFAGVFSEIEKELKKSFATTKPRNRYAANTSDDLIYLIQNSFMNEKNPKQLMSLLLAQGRHHSLNLRSYLKYKTVEFRLFNSTYHLPAIELMTDFSSKLVHAVRTQNPKLMIYLIQNDEPIRLQDVARILDMKIAQPEAKMILDKIFSEAQNRFQVIPNQRSGEPPHLRNLTTLLGIVAAINQISDQIQELFQ